MCGIKVSVFFFLSRTIPINADTFPTIRTSSVPLYGDTSIMPFRIVSETFEPEGVGEKQQNIVEANKLYYINIFLNNHM